MTYADPRFIASITANGQTYSSWESVMVRRDFGDGISTFRFAAAEGSYGPRYSGLKLKPGDAVTVTLGGQKVITGYVTTRSGAYDENSHQLVIAGKSKTCDLKDSSVAVKPGTYDGSTFEQAARGVMAPHPVQLVMSNASTIASKPFPSLAVQYGETVAEFISRTAAMRGLFITDNEDGNLVAGQGDPSSAPTAELIEGVNIKRCSFLLDDQTKFSKYEGAGQQPGTDDNWPPRANSAAATDAEARPNRYKLFIAEHPADSEELTQRVNHEAAVSGWQEVRLGIVVVGWLKPDGSLWKPVENISVFSPMAFPDVTGMYTLGVQSCTWSQDDQNGTETMMELVLPNKLTVNPTAGISDIGSSNPQPATPGTPI